MPRPDKTKGAPFWYNYKLDLKEHQKRRIFDELLGFDWDDKKDQKKAKQVVLNIESYLGAYAGMVESTDKAPTAAQYIVELENFRKQTLALLEELMGTSYWMHDLMTQHGCDLHEVIQQFATFFDVTVKAIKHKENEESRGRPPRKALRILVNSIHKNFMHYTKNKEAHLDFIKECLDAAKIEYPQNIASLIYDDSTPEKEREYIMQTG